VSPHLGRAAFRIAFFIAFVSGALLFFLEPGSAEFVVSVVTLLIGLIFMVAIAVIVRRVSR